ncbi:MAG: hypothetical protein KDA66_07705 [Planctomycetaceae bacterium]|nr:hypothetical protein [Planctomycetaceae bacterium]
METGRRIFAAGAILGIAVGFFGGHFTVWTSPGVDEAAQSLSTSNPYPFADLDISFTPEGIPVPESELKTAFAVAPEGSLADATPDIGTEAPPELMPLAPSEPILDTRPVADIAPETLIEPNPLKVPHAAPIVGAPSLPPPKLSNPQADEAIRELISKELAGRPKHEQDVWFDSLKGLSVPHAIGVLEMWKLSGGSPSPLSFPSPEPHAEPPLFGDLNEPPLSAFPAVANPAIQTHIQNLRHANTPGYRCRRRYTVAEVGSTANAVTIDFSSGSSRDTGSPFDLLVGGTGFFVVECDGERRYTRYGHFTLDEERRVALELGEQTWKLVPELTIPSDAISVKVSPEGVVTATQSDNNEHEIGKVSIAHFLNVQGLKPDGPVLFAATSAAGGELPPSADARSIVRQGSLELSNVVADAEWDAIEQATRLAELERGSLN